MMLCPHCRKQTAMEIMPEGYATNRWAEAVALGTRKEEPYARCPVCTATFPAWAVIQPERACELKG